jgi:hypothetical protein
LAPFFYDSANELWPGQAKVLLKQKGCTPLYLGANGLLTGPVKGLQTNRLYAAALSQRNYSGSGQLQNKNKRSTAARAVTPGGVLLRRERTKRNQCDHPQPPQGGFELRAKARIFRLMEGGARLRSKVTDTIAGSVPETEKRPAPGS